MAKGYLLSEADRDLLRRVMPELRRRFGNTLNRPYVEQPDGDAPEVFVALSPVGTIPAMTGTTPGSATCAIYRRATGGTLEALTGLSRVVYNLSSSAVIAGTYPIVTRDKFGEWYVVAPGSGGGSSLIVGEVIGAGFDVANVTEIEFDQADGFAVSGAAGIARVDQLDATATQAGKMSTGVQTFAGAKTFNGTVICSASTTYSLQVTSAIAYFGPSSSCQFFGTTNFQNVGNYAYNFYFMDGGGVTNGAVTVSVVGLRLMGAAVSPYTEACYLDITGSTGSVTLDSSSGASNTTVLKFNVRDASGTIRTGATGTDRIGNTVYGGIICGTVGVSALTIDGGTW